MHNQGIACVGTVRANCLPNCKTTPDATMKDMGRETIQLWTSDYDDVELRAIKWFDNQGVSFLSTYESVNPVVHLIVKQKKALLYHVHQLSALTISFWVV